MNNGGGDGTSCFKIKIRTDAAKLTNVRITRYRQCRDLVRESEMFIKDKAKTACRVSGINRSVLYFSELLSVTNEEKLQPIFSHRLTARLPLTRFLPRSAPAPICFK